jgi:hypothetical protein
MERGVSERVRQAVPPPQMRFENFLHPDLAPWRVNSQARTPALHRSSTGRLGRHGLQIELDVSSDMRPASHGCRGR